MKIHPDLLNIDANRQQTDCKHTIGAEYTHSRTAKMAEVKILIKYVWPSKEIRQELIRR